MAIDGVSLAVPTVPVTVKVSAAGVAVPPDAYVPVAALVTVNVVEVGHDAIATLVRLYALGVIPVIVMTIPGVNP